MNIFPLTFVRGSLKKPIKICSVSVPQLDTLTIFSCEGEVYLPI